MTAWTLGMAPVVYAHPILDAAGAGVNVSGTTDMSITSANPNNFIKWVDFSIGSTEKVTFDAKNYLNYVTGSARSDILGTLMGGGHIYLVNPNGILIGDSAVINVGNLHLSTRTLSDEVLNNFAASTSATPPNPLTDGAIGGDVINMGKLNATSISVEGNNITFKNVADVTKNTLNAAGEIIGTTQNTAVTLTANSGGEIHIGSASGGASGYTTSGATYNYKLVSDATELQNMKDDLSGNYMLAGNINANSIEGFTPIGTESGPNAFSGRFDGLNYTVSNLHLNAVDCGTAVRAGLFGYNKGVVENLEVAGTTTVTNDTGCKINNLGAVAAYNGGILRNVRNTSTIDASDINVENFGGVAGVNTGAIDRAYNTGALTAKSDNYNLNLGGIAGRNVAGDTISTITNAFNTGTLEDNLEDKDKTTASFVGGITGYIAGGIAGGSIENAYNSGALTQSGGEGTRYLGGIVGYLSDNNSTVQHTYNSGTLDGKKDVGGIVGCCGSAGTITDNYSTTTGNGGNHNDGVKLPADNKMKQATTYTGFDFSANGAWRIYKNSTMPLLTAFLTRADHDNGTAEYNGAATGDVGTNYVASNFSGVVNQIGGVNYVYDYTKVTPKALTLTAGSIDKTYDGTDTATLTANNLSGVVAGDTLTVSTTSATYADKNVGTGKTVTYAGLTLGGTKAGNYTISASGSTTGNITAKEISVSFDDISKTYDGTTNATAGQGKLTDVLDADKDKVSVTGKAEYADKNAGTDKQVNYSDVRLTGDEAGNYTLAANTATGKGSIAKADITISTDAVTKTYDGKTSATGVAIVTSGQMFGTDVISGGTFAFTDKNAGTNKTVTVSDVTVIDGNDGGNYNVTYEANTTSTINRAEAIVTFKSTTKTYDGTTSATPGEAEFFGLMPADKGKVGVTADAAYEDQNVGTDKKVKYTNITLTGTEAQNYYPRDTYVPANNGIITRRPLWLVANPVTITEGEATPTTWSGTVTGFVEGEGLTDTDSLAFALDNPAASAVGSYAVTGSLNGNSFYDYGTNYSFSNAEANKTAFTIKAKQMTPKEIIENATDAPSAAKEYTDVVASLDSGANTVLPTTNVLPTESVVPTNSVLPTGNNLPTGNTQQTGSNQPTGSAQPTEPAAQENNSASGEQNETQEQNGLLPAQQTTGGQPAAGRQETQLGLTYTDINMPESMSVEALAATMNGEPTQQSGAPAASNAPATEPTTQNAPTTEPTTAVPGTSEANNEEE